MNEFLFGIICGACLAVSGLLVVIHSVAFRLGNFLERMEWKLSNLSDEIAALGTTVTDAEARVSTDVQALRDRIAELEAIIAAGSATPEDIAALEALRQRIANIDPAIVSPTP